MKQLLTTLTTAALLCGAGLAQASEVILSVRSGDALHEFTLPQLRAIGEVEVSTSTIWTEGEQSFVGVPLHSLMAGLGIDEGVVTAAAVNDYAVTIPMAEVEAHAPIIAFERNGEEMSLRDKGPLWVVYPYDSDPSYRTEEVYARSIWQLNRIAVE